MDPINKVILHSLPQPNKLMLLCDLRSGSQQNRKERCPPSCVILAHSPAVRFCSCKLHWNTQKVVLVLLLKKKCNTKSHLLQYHAIWCSQIVPAAFAVCVWDADNNVLALSEDDKDKCPSWKIYPFLGPITFYIGDNGYQNKGETPHQGHRQQ